MDIHPRGATLLAIELCKKSIQEFSYTEKPIEKAYEIRKKFINGMIFASVCDIMNYDVDKTRKTALEKLERIYLEATEKRFIFNPLV